MANTPNRNMRIPDQQWDALTIAALEAGLSPSEWVRVAIRKQLEGWVLPTVPAKFIPAEQVDDIEFKVSSSRETFYANLKGALIRYTTVLGDVWDEGALAELNQWAPPHMEVPDRIKNSNPYRVVLDNKEEQK